LRPENKVGVMAIWTAEVAASEKDRRGDVPRKVFGGEFL
jgi:hypothetical protein